MKLLKTRRSAFSLVEAVLALGIATFALTALMGMLPVAMTSGKSSLDDTLIAAMASDALSDLKRKSFVVSGDSNQAAEVSVLAGTEDVSTGEAPAKVVTDLFFDVNGGSLKDASGQPLAKAAALAAGAIYQCTRTVEGDPDTLSAPDSNSAQVVNLVRVQLKFVWPAQAANPPNQKLIHASIARY